MPFIFKNRQYTRICATQSVWGYNYVKFDNIDIDNVEGNSIFSENCILAEALSFVVAHGSSVVEGKTGKLLIIIIIKDFRNWHTDSKVFSFVNNNLV